MCEGPHTYLFLEFRKIFSGETTELFAPVRCNETVGFTATILPIIKDAKPQGRCALLACADDDLIKVLAECAINMLNGNHKLS